MIRLQKLSKAEWEPRAEFAHRIAFNEKREGDRSTFALMAIEDEKPLGYMSCIEMDAETVYLQFGGLFPPGEKSIRGFRGYALAIEELRGQYKNLFTLIENTNLAMLKMALKVGFLIVGTRYFKGSLMVELAC